MKSTNTMKRKTQKDSEYKTKHGKAKYKTKYEKQNRKYQKQNKN